MQYLYCYSILFIWMWKERSTSEVCGSFSSPVADFWGDWCSICWMVFDQKRKKKSDILCTHHVGHCVHWGWISCKSQQYNLVFFNLCFNLNHSRIWWDSNLNIQLLNHGEILPLRNKLSSWIHRSTFWNWIGTRTCIGQCSLHFRWVFTSVLLLRTGVFHLKFPCLLTNPINYWNRGTRINSKIINHLLDLD